MLIITRYFTREFLKIFFLCQATFVTLYLLVDLFENLDSVIKNKAPLGAVIRYFLFNVPLVVYQVSPLAVLLCTFITIGLFVRYNEITALKAHGISLFSVFNVFLFISMFTGVFSLGLQEYVLPYTNRQLKEIKNVQIKGKQSTTIFTRDNFWYRTQDAIFNIEYFYPGKNMLQGITIYYFSPDFHLRERIDAKWAVWKNDGDWTFHDGMVRVLQTDAEIKTELFSEKVIALHETPEDFKLSQKMGEEMSFGEIRAFVNKVSSEGYDTTPYEVDMHAKISYPFINIIMAILGIPFALMIGRSGGMALGITTSVFIGFFYWIFFALCLSLGKSSSLPPLLSAWMANAAFGALGVYMFLQVKQ
ncbi:MAG: LPS export ABC transporter permease LptG [Proteobacteria bacterium]|nr:LPS export ABC transporter permease LptG [Pseudomonadota bacterium]